MEERTGLVTMKGNPLVLLGPEITVGQKAPDFEVTANDLSKVKLSDYKGKVCIISSVPSLDTPVCDIETKRFIEEAGKLGGDVQVTIGDLGAGLEASTTTNLGADIVGFAHAQGVFMGFSLEGAVIGRRSDLNSAYYGVGKATPEEIIKQRKHWNTQADPLRQALLITPEISSHQLSALER